MNKSDFVGRAEHQEEKEFVYRKALFAPATLDEAARSIEAVGATENPARIWDPERWEAVDEVLLMSGCVIPEGAQIPLTIEHERSAACVIGSYREMRIENRQLVGRAFFASDPDADKYYTRVRDGHLDSFSVAYRASGRESVWVPEGEALALEGQEFRGPVLVTKRWTPGSMGLVIYGADSKAKARSENFNNDKREKVEMDKLRARLVKMGMNPNATEAEMEAFIAGLPDAEKVRAEVESAKAEVKRAEIERSGEIVAMCNRFNIENKEMQEMITGGDSVEIARAKVMDIVERRMKENNPGFTPATPATVTQDERDKFRSAAGDALIMRSGFQVQTPAPGALDLRGWSLTEIARQFLRIGNQNVGGGPMDMVARALQTTDFPIILSATANRSVFEGWNGADEDWSQWCGEGQVPNFLSHEAVGLSEGDDLDEMPEGQPYKYGSLDERKELYQIATFGKRLALTRQAIINDSLGAFVSVGRKQGEAAARKIGDIAYAVLIANAAMVDTYALFHANHSNLVAHGSGAAPGVNTLAAGFLAMALQKDVKGLRSLNIRPRFMIAPKAREAAAEVFFKTTTFSDHSTVATDSSFASTRANIYSGDVLKRIYNARLDDDDPAAWYLAAEKGKTIVVYFLNGQKEPYLETKPGWDVDGLEYKVRIDAGAAAIDWRGLYMNDGN
jgi:hypothetical protein